MKLKIPCQIFLRRISQSKIRNSAAEGGGNSATPSLGLAIFSADLMVVIIISTATIRKIPNLSDLLASKFIIADKIFT